MTRPIRVLHLLVTTSPGGGPKHVYDLVRHLPRDQFETVVAAPRDGVFFDRFQDLGGDLVELPLSRLGVRHLPLTMRLCRAHRIDIVHTHGKARGCTAGWPRARSESPPSTPSTGFTTAAIPGWASGSTSPSSAGSPA